MTSRASTELQPVPRIDHVMIMLDPVTYQDVASNVFVDADFGRTKRKEADSSLAGKYGTLGIAGTHTLIELFCSETPGSGPLVGGLVFSFEEPGSSPLARAKLNDGQVGYYHDLVRRAVPGQDDQQPWYHLISVDLGEASPFLLFLNEVTPEYFATIGARPTAEGALSRQAYLDSVVGPVAGEPRLMQDIVGMTLTVGPERARRITGALTALGFTAAVDGAVHVLEGPGLTIRLDVGETEPERVAEVEIALTPGPRTGATPTELRFGETSRLVIDGDRARWTFRPVGVSA